MSHPDKSIQLRNSTNFDHVPNSNQERNYIINGKGINITNLI